MQHHFAEKIGTFEQTMGCRRLVQGKALVNDRAHAPQGHEADQRLHILRAPAAHAHDAQSPDKDLPQVQFHPMASRHAAGHQAAIVLQAAKTRLPDRRADVFDDN